MTHQKITIFCDLPTSEVLMAELAQIGFDGFVEIDGGLEAYITSEAFNPKAFDRLLHDYAVAVGKVSHERLEERNWNDEWERSFTPVTVRDQVRVRASFHKVEDTYPIDIIIDPKQAFGTGHHATTSMMMAEQLEIDHRGKRLLDVGTGTGILTILGYKLGAGELVATDIDPQCIENCRENFALNEVQNVALHCASIENLTSVDDCDIVLANINLHVLRDQLSAYASRLKKDGTLLLSGFYVADRPEIEEIAAKSHLHLLHSRAQDDWSCLVFTHLR